MMNIPTFTIEDLLNAGIHFGHKRSRWNPKMAPYIYGVRDDIHVIDLKYSASLLRVALNQIYNIVKQNGRILFVGTKTQASPLIAEAAERCGQYYVNHRWLGGMLTNWGTVSKSIKTLEKFEAILKDEEVSATYTKKELLDIERKCEKLNKSLGGIRSLGGQPDALFIIDTNKEKIAILEAKKLGIPVIAIVDTNCDPEEVDFPIPGNDDAIKSIKLYCDLMASAAIAGISQSLVDSGVDIGELADDIDFTKAKEMHKNANKKNLKKTDDKRSNNEEDLEKSKKFDSKTRAIKTAPGSRDSDTTNER